MLTICHFALTFLNLPPWHSEQATGFNAYHLEACYISPAFTSAIQPQCSLLLHEAYYPSMHDIISPHCYWQHPHSFLHLLPAAPPLPLRVTSHTVFACYHSCTPQTTRTNREGTIRLIKDYKGYMYTKLSFRYLRAANEDVGIFLEERENCYRL